MNLVGAAIAVRRGTTQSLRCVRLTNKQATHSPTPPARWPGTVAIRPANSRLDRERVCKRLDVGGGGVGAS